jgi:serine phosphatase RsbU (regulator of sigma subunit)/anti-sigma regulatory factor (Ser/Thr protein kinase)
MRTSAAGVQGVTVTTTGESEPPEAATSSGTLMLGVDIKGAILHCGQNADLVLGMSPADLLDTPLTELFADVPEHAAALASLVEAIRTGQDRWAMLPLRYGGSGGRAVVTVQPMCAGDDHPLAALVVLRVPLPPAGRFADPAVMRRALLDQAQQKAGSTLDLDQVARELVDVVVPHFCSVAGLVLLESLVGSDEVSPIDADGRSVVRRLALATDDGNATWYSTFPTGEILTYPPGSMYTECLASARPVLRHFAGPAESAVLSETWHRPPVADLFVGGSFALLPLVSDDVMMGFLVCFRGEGHRRFDDYDINIGMEFAARAAKFIDNARQFSRERATALTLQRSLLPTGLSAPTTVQVRHRYLPGSRLVEVGGDWYESIALPGARVALIIGDVAGHGVKAAVTMGRLRSALHTLANLDLPPVEALTQLDELMRELGQREPHFATCVYAIFDATRGMCEIASAGHLAPLLLRPNGVAEYLEVPPSPPLGVAGTSIESRIFTIEDGSLFVLYTDGLVESRGRDIDDGLDRLRGVFGAQALDSSLEELCKATLDGIYGEQYRDDIAVLIARLSSLPPERFSTWMLEGGPTAAHEARELVREQMTTWELPEDLIFSAELLVSELVTNAVRYGDGPVELRLLRDHTLVCEVEDTAPAMPRKRRANAEDEGGRGLQVVAEVAERWGSRRTADGKVVWAELMLPGAPGDRRIEAWPGETLHR